METRRAAHYALLLEAPWGRIRVTLCGMAVCGVDLGPVPPESIAPCRSACSADEPFAGAVRAAFADYFSHPKPEIDLPLKVEGTAFQRRVWRQLRSIPPGEVMTYGEVAKQVGGGARAVGSACRANPIPILTPCHRVVARGGIGGFAGETGGERIAIKRWLLCHEGVLPG